MFLKSRFLHMVGVGCYGSSWCDPELLAKTKTIEHEPLRGCDTLPPRPVQVEPELNAHSLAPPPPLPSETLAALCSDVQQSAVVDSDAAPLPSPGWLETAPVNDMSSAAKEERALKLLRGRPGWFKHADKDLGPMFYVHPSTVSRWRKSWLEQGLVEVKTVKRRVWMRIVEAE